MNLGLKPVNFNEIPGVLKASFEIDNFNSITALAVDKLNSVNTELRISKDNRLYFLEFNSNANGLVKALIELRNFIIKCYYEGFFSDKDLPLAKILRSFEGALGAGIEAAAYGLKSSMGVHKETQAKIFKEINKSIISFGKSLNEVEAYFQEKFREHPELLERSNQILERVRYHLDALVKVPHALTAITEEARKKYAKEALLPADFRAAFDFAYNPQPLLPQQEEPFQAAPSPEIVAAKLPDLTPAPPPRRKQENSGRKADAVFPFIKQFVTPQVFQSEILRKIDNPANLPLVRQLVLGELSKIQAALDSVNQASHRPFPFSRKQMATGPEKTSALEMIVAHLSLISLSLNQASMKNTVLAEIKRETIDPRIGDLKKKIMQAMINHTDIDHHIVFSRLF